MVNVNGNNIISTITSDNWDQSGACSSKKLISGDGFVEATLEETDKYRMLALSNTFHNGGYTQLNFAMYMAAQGGLSFYENGTSPANLGTYQAGDKVKISVEDGKVKYYLNDTVKYISQVEPTYPLLAEASFYSSGATLSNVNIYGFE